MMAIIEQIRLFFDSMETTIFYRYTAIFFGICITLSCVIVFYYYSNVNSLFKEIKKNNVERSQNVITILEQAAQLNLQREAVNETVSKDPNFKIEGYFKEILASLNLIEKNKSPFTTTTNERENKYREVELNAEFENMNMKEVAELLQALEKNPRIATKRLEITSSKKKMKTVEVLITITTLLPKTETL